MNNDELLNEVVKRVDELSREFSSQTNKMKQFVDSRELVYQGLENKRKEYFDDQISGLSKKFDEYVGVIQKSLIEHDFNNAKRTADIIDSNKLLACVNLRSSAAGYGQAPELILYMVNELEELIKSRNTVI